MQRDLGVEPVESAQAREEGGGRYRTPCSSCPNLKNKKPI
jgi:hypothetical protein